MKFRKPKPPVPEFDEQKKRAKQFKQDSIKHNSPQSYLIEVSPEEEQERELLHNRLAEAARRVKQKPQISGCEEFIRIAKEDIRTPELFLDDEKIREKWNNGLKIQPMLKYLTEALKRGFSINRMVSILADKFGFSRSNLYAKVSELAEIEKSLSLSPPTLRKPQKQKETWSPKSYPCIHKYFFNGIWLLIGILMIATKLFIPLIQNLFIFLLYIGTSFFLLIYGGILQETFINNKNPFHIHHPFLKIPMIFIPMQMVTIMMAGMVIDRTQSIDLILLDQINEILPLILLIIIAFKLLINDSSFSWVMRELSTKLIIILGYLLITYWQEIQILVIK